MDAFEAALAATNPWLRRHFGVYTTPPEVVSAQVELVDDLLKRRLGLAAGLGAPNVLIVDPAAGTGAYPLAVTARAPAARLHLFEPLAEAADLARARLNGAAVRFEVQDAFAQPYALDAPVLVCIGNPPYHRQTVARGEQTARKGGWVRFGAPRPILRDFVDPAAGVHTKSIYNDYVYFWRWAVWLVCEQRSGPGIVSLITPSSFLHGPGFGAMRAWLRRQFDALWVVDLEGDGRGTRRSDSVFESVLTPVAICMGARFGTATASGARLHYVAFTGSRTDKLTRLASVRAVDDLPWQRVRDDVGPFVPRPRSGYATWPKLTDLFPLQFSGCQMKRRWPIAPSIETLRRRWSDLLARPLDERLAAFQPTRDRSIDSTPFGLVPLRDLPADAPCPVPARYAYRAFDRHWVLADPRLGDFLRPGLWRLATPRQVFLTSLLTHPLGPGPAVVATRLVPDLDHFRGSFGGRAVMPLWKDDRPNLAPGLLDRLSTTYGQRISPERLLGYCYALLATPAYQARFADELREPGARVPLTTDAALFCRAAALGGELLRIHTYDEVPAGRARIGVPVEAGVASYSVSGLRVVASWLRHRAQEHWTAALEREFLELQWLIEATLARLPALDALLAEVIAKPTLHGYAWTAHDLEH